MVLSFFLLSLPALLLRLLPAAPAVPDAGALARLEAARNVGLAALEEGNLPEAKKRFETVRRLAPGDPLGWANGAVAALRGNALPEAKSFLAEALKIAPSDARVLALVGMARELSGETAAAVEAFEKAATANPKDLPSRWAAARLLAEKVRGGGRRAISAVEAALAESPANSFLLLRLSELLRKEGEKERALALHERLAAALPEGDEKLERYLGEAKALLSAGDAAADLKYRIVENLLRPSAPYQQARREVEPGVVGIPLENWSAPLASRALARAGTPVPVTFEPRAGGAGLSALRNLAAVRVGGSHARDLVFAGEGGIVVASSSPGGYRAAAPIPGSSARAIAVADFTNSGRLDVASPGALWVSGELGFARTPIPDGQALTALDFDADGDLDLYVSSRAGDRLLRNNLDGSWTDVTPAAGLPRGLASLAAVAGDFDRDGDIDLVAARAGGGLVLLDNLRGGRLAEKEAGLPPGGVAAALQAGDLDADGRLDLVWSSASESRIAANRGDGAFRAGAAIEEGGGTPLFFDFDNDGFLDLLLARPKGPSRLLRNGGSGSLSAVAAGPLPAALDAEAIDFDRDGDLDLVVVTDSGRAALLENRGGNANGWIDVALEGLATGSAKVNRLGYGSEVEVKAEALYAYRTVTRPVTHVGLGSRRRPDVLRVVWTNGIPQNTLSPPARTLVKEVQQLKGSCPFVYAYDGRGWHFVTDALGRSPLGLLFDGVHQAAADTREWLLVSGDQLGESKGRLLLDFTEELWEVAYLDLAQLRAVDHPAGVEIVPDEKMVPPPFPPKRLYTLSRPATPRAFDENGRDRTAEIARQDGVFAGGFAPTRFQGLVGAHDLVLELSEARAADRVMLYLTGWIFYTDTSINVSLSQGSLPKPFGPVLEVPDGQGGWRAALPAIGYPAGKTKTMPVDLSEILDRKDPRVRIRTNLEIYWDRIAYTVDELPAPLRLSPAPLLSARLFFRGFSSRTRESAEGPHVFVHDDVDTTPRWADMTGLYTRLGDVRELVWEVDDRYVVMKGGDAVRLEFDARALPPLPEGWLRDWILVLDGWDKDGDKNTVAGQTVEPLPFHGQDDTRYGEETFPDSEAHRRFQREYLTRRAGPAEFRDFLRGSR